MWSALGLLVCAITLVLSRSNVLASLLATALILIVVQTLWLLRLDLKLTKKLAESSNRPIPVTGNEVSSRLESGAEWNAAQLHQVAPQRRFARTPIVA